jgi:hypothetical protein
MRLFNSARYDDYASSRPALCDSLFLVRPAELKSYFSRCGMAYSLSVCLVCLGVMEGSVTDISIIVSAVLTLSSSFPFSETCQAWSWLLVCFILLPFYFFYSPLIEPGALNSQKLILSIIFAQIYPSPTNHFVLHFYTFILFCSFLVAGRLSKSTQTNTQLFLLKTC